MLSEWLASTADRAMAAAVIRPSLRRTATEHAPIDPDSPVEARCFFHARAASSALLLVHGYLGGRYAIEARAWPVRRWFARGHDVVLLTLPFHGVHGGPARRIFEPEAIAKAIGDLRLMVQRLRERGATRVAAMGMSLGGYLVSLLATLEPALDLVVPVVPLADLSAFARGELPVAPPRITLRRAPVRMLVVGAERDAIAPLAHAHALASHFHAPLVTFRGGHVLQLGREAAFATIDRMLERTGS
ncbi:MAG: hypothetical protein U0270_37680 [Labilithrix sp.]